jgi:hypothetical protein
MNHVRKLGPCQAQQAAVACVSISATRKVLPFSLASSFATSSSPSRPFDLITKMASGYDRALSGMLSQIFYIYH